MGERKGQNKYYPPDYDPKVHGSLNAYHGTHYLRERARKLDRGIIIIRFEMPFNVWCLGCGRHIAMGVRYNADKTKEGMYHSTPIFKFRMKCHLCDMYFEIKNDPKNFTYELVSGLRRKEQNFNAAENGAFELEDAETRLRRAADKMFKLEHERADAQKSDDARPQLERIEQINARLRDDFSLNQLARSRFRTEKKKTAEAQKANEAVAKRLSLAGSGVQLLDASEIDTREAALIRLSTIRCNDALRTESARRNSVLKSSIFDTKHARQPVAAKQKRRKTTDSGSRSSSRNASLASKAGGNSKRSRRGDAPCSSSTNTESSTSNAHPTGPTESPLSADSLPAASSAQLEANGEKDLPLDRNACNDPLKQSNITDSIEETKSSVIGLKHTDDNGSLRLLCACYDSDNPDE